MVPAMSAALAASKPLIGRQITRSVEQLIRARPSFKDLSSRADRLERGDGDGDSSSAESIAAFLLNLQQEFLESRLRERLRDQPYTFRHLIHLLRFLAYCSWRSSLICGSLLKAIFDAKCFITRIHNMLQSPASHSHVRDILLCLVELHNLFTEVTVNRIGHANLLLTDLKVELRLYAERVRVRAVSRLSAVRRRSKRAILGCACGSNVQSRDIGGLLDTTDDLATFSATLSTPKDASRMMSVPGDMLRDVPTTPGAVSGILPFNGQVSGRSAFGYLHKLDMYLHQIEGNMHAVIVTFDTLKPLLTGTQSHGVGSIFMDFLRDDPLMFDGVSKQITDCHTKLSRHLDDVREQVLLCFTYINKARELACSL